MIQFKAKIEGKFAQSLQERLAQVQANRDPSARVTVPAADSWWYFNEFGTATKHSAPTSAGNAEIAPIPPPIHGGGTYPIDPVNAKELRFPQGGEVVFRSHVDHPGIRPSRSVTKALPEIEQVFMSKVSASFADGAADNPAQLQEVVLEVANEAKALIVQSMAENLNGTRSIEPELGKLGGRTASQVFDSDAQVVSKR